MPDESGAQVNDLSENFLNGITTLEKSTETTYEMLKLEHEKSRKHFHQMRVELATQTSEIVNAFLRRINDCVLSIESYENRFDQLLNDTTNEYHAKGEKMKDLKKSCKTLPLPEFLPHLTDVSSKLSVDVQAFTNQMMIFLREFLQPPELLFDTVPILNVMNNAVKFNICGQAVHPIYRTDPSINLIEVPILKLAENPIVAIAGNQKPGEKRSGGPFSDAVAAKKARAELLSGRSVAEIAGTKVTHATIKNATPYPSAPSFQPPLPPNVPYVNGRGQRAILPPPPSIPRFPSVAARKPRSVAQQFAPHHRAAPVISFKNCGPVSIVHHQQQQHQQQHPTYVRPRATIRYVNRPLPSQIPPSYGIPVSSGYGQKQQVQQNYEDPNGYGNNPHIAEKQLPVHLQIRPKPLTRIVNCPAATTDHPIRSNDVTTSNQHGNNKQNLPRVPVVPALKKGSDSMQKALMDVVQATSPKKDSSKDTSKSTDIPSPPSAFDDPSKSDKRTNESVDGQESNESTNGKLRRSARLSKHK